MQRFRRLRKNAVIRGMMQETRLHPKDFIYPIFVAEGENLENPVASMPGVFQYSLDRLDGILNRVRRAAFPASCCLVSPPIRTSWEARPMRRTELPRGR